MRRIWRWILVCLALGLAANSSRAEDSLRWRTKENKVDAQIKDWDLRQLLGRISRATGWQVFMEPGATATISCKFKDLPQDEALRRLLGNLNFAKDETNGVVRLLVARSVPGAATQVVKKDYRIANEALVKLKNGAATNTIDRLAKSLGAKVLGRDDRIGLYRLQFADASAADAAMQALAADPSVGAVDANYSVDRPNPAAMSLATSGAPSFTLNPQANANGPVVGLVDTAAFPPGPFQSYSLTPINVTGVTDTPSSDPTHGTMMFETLVEGMANDPSKILPVDVYGTGETTTTYEVMEGIVAAVNAGANPINLSLGGTGESDLLGNLIAAAEAKNVVFVAATGNTPGEGEVYPADYPGVYAVTASTQAVTAPGIEGVFGGQLASYANDPAGTSIMAPGTSYITWDGQTWVPQGTSVATADVTAVAVDLANQDHISLVQAMNLIKTAMPAPR